MSEKAISQKKRLACGDEVRKYAKGGMVTPRVKPVALGGATKGVPKAGCGCGMKCGGKAKKP